MGEEADYLIQRMQDGRMPVGRVRSKSKSAEPGSPLARARMMAHKAFDPKWESGKMSRNEAYHWLAKELKIPKEQCHMMLMDEATCLEVVRLCTVDSFEDLSC
jgi:hypothetical protein